MDLQLLANIAFECIEKNTGKAFPHVSLQESFNSFKLISETFGISWLIDATTGSGMTHTGWITWMSYAREQIGLSD